MQTPIHMYSVTHVQPTYESHMNPMRINVSKYLIRLRYCKIGKMYDIDTIPINLLIISFHTTYYKNMF